ncbi:MAG: FtsX-like permease family protein [Endozoicomonas sp. (ex Botrylloides leachii)]|nr:FtsX-like permease family protein [Endozoicomonas sp. (ex Botrylloides leachii)]
MTITKLAWKSLKNRKATAILTILSITVSVALLLGVERIRTEAKQGFTHTLSGTDLIIGARSSPVNLLLYSVFHIGNATNNVSWKTYKELSNQPEVAWSIPLSLGDSHQGYRVVGTENQLFSHFKYANKQSLTFSDGKPFDDIYDAVIGCEVAEKLHYHVNQKIILSHGVQGTRFQEHGDKPFTVSGILTCTNTPLDRVILVSLEGIEALHLDWINGAPPLPSLSISAAKTHNMDLTPTSITAWMVGLKSKIAVFQYQRKINQYKPEALTAILPGIVLQRLWVLVGSAENALLAISIMVFLAGLIGMLTTILASLNERRREMAILRSIGARPRHIFLLMIYESIIYAMAGILFGFMLVYGLLAGLKPLLESKLSLHISLTWPGHFELILAGFVLLSSVLFGIIPAWRAYKTSLSDGLAIKL